WFLVLKADQQELLEILKGRLEGSGVEVLLDRRARERRRGSLGPAMDRRVSDRRRQRPIGQLSVVASPSAETVPEPDVPARRAASARHGSITHRRPTRTQSVELARRPT